MAVSLNSFKGILGKVPITRATGRFNQVRELAKVAAGAHAPLVLADAHNLRTAGAGAQSLLGDMGRHAGARLMRHAAAGAAVGATAGAARSMAMGDEYGNRSARGAFQGAVRGGVFGGVLGAGIGAGRIAFGEAGLGRTAAGLRTPAQHAARAEARAARAVGRMHSAARQGFARNARGMANQVHAMESAHAGFSLGAIDLLKQAKASVAQSGKRWNELLS